MSCNFSEFWKRNGLGTWSIGCFLPRREDNIPIGANVSTYKKIIVIVKFWMFWFKIWCSSGLYTFRHVINFQSLFGS